MGGPLHYNESVAEKAFLLRFTFCVKTEECNDFVKMLQLYEESGLIRTEKTESGETDYPEAELRKAAQLCALQRAGMELEELKKLCDLQRSGCCEAKIRLLRKCRCRLLEQIHQKQQALDRLDYLIYRMKNPKE